MRSDNYISQIDAIRAIAVIAVILNHYFETILPMGFLGVDIFFVISGYVITKGLHERRIDALVPFLSSFYARRVRRLLPALMVCVLVMAFLFFFLASKPSKETFKTGAMALIGVSNIYLYVRAEDYFALNATLNPFTHTWSLGVEEQFYLCFPILLFLCYQRGEGYRDSRLTITLLAITASSLALYAWLLSRDVSAAFYLMPGRAWEFGVGALTCLMFRQREERLGQAFYFVALGLLLMVLCGGLGSGLISTLACVALTAVIIQGIGSGKYYDGILGARTLVGIGLLSYSLYLWHWGFLVLLKYTVGQAVAYKVVALILAIIFAAISYVYVEKVWRYGRSDLKPRTVIASGFGAALILGIVVATLSPKHAPSLSSLLPDSLKVEAATMWSLPCHGKESLKPMADPYEACLGGVRSENRPNFYLLGDSHAAQLHFMLDKALPRAGYGLRFINSEQLDDFPHAYFEGIWHTPTTDFVLKNARRGDVVGIAFHKGRLNDKRDDHIKLGREVPINDKTTHVIEALSVLLSALKAKGVGVVLFNDTPLMMAVATSETCALQKRLFARSSCVVGWAQDQHTGRRQRLAFDALAQRYGNVAIWDAGRAVFDGRDEIDVISDDGHYIMMDWNHISQWQSEKMAPDFLRFFQAWQLESIKQN